MDNVLSRTKTLWLGTFENFDGTPNWLIFSSPPEDEILAKKRFKKVYKDEIFGDKIANDDFSVYELDNVDGFKICLLRGGLQKTQ